MPSMRLRTLLALALIGPLAACSGSSPSGSTPPVPVRTLVATGSQSDVPPVTEGVVFFITVQVQASTVLEATVDWSSPSNQVAVLWGQGDCNADPNCTILVQNASAAKPKTVTTPTVTPGTYTLAVVNLGTTNESVSYQIFIIH